MSDHTPGPWTYGGQAGRSRGLIYAGPTTEGRPLGIQQVAVVTQDPMLAGGSPEANGLLLAAAPDLLDVCKRVLAAARKHTDGSARLDVAYLDDLRAVIARAKEATP